jgi:hypothetical protein
MVDFRSLWEVDRCVAELDLDARKALGARSFASAFAEAIGSCAAQHVSEALVKMLTLQEAADGWLAQEIADSNLSVFERSPAVLVENLGVLKSRPWRVGFGTTSFPERQSDIGVRYRAYCAEKRRPANECEEALAFLARD